MMGYEAMDKVTVFIKSIKLTKMIPTTKKIDNRYVKTINKKSMVL